MGSVQGVCCICDKEKWIRKTCDNCDGNICEDCRYNNDTIDGLELCSDCYNGIIEMRENDS